MRGGPVSGIVVGVSTEQAIEAAIEVAIEAASKAFQRLVDALDRPRDPVLLRAAVTDDVRIDRHAPGDRATAPVAETFTGIAEVERWFARTPPSVRFGLAGAARLEPEPEHAWAIEYTIDAGEFHNGGVWLARLAADGRIAILSHHPFALRDGGSLHAHGGSSHTHGG
ncbi:MAG TPA: hypothetical protein VF469_04350 [Kofleriaceae bacterium]